MGVYKRPRKEWKNGKPLWYVQINYQKQRHNGGVFTVYKDAQDADEKLLARLKSKQSRPILTDNITVDLFIPKFLEHRKTNRAVGTVVREELRSHPILKYFNNIRLTHISTGDIHDYVAKRLKDGLQNRSINLELTFLRSFYKYAIECNVADFNPARSVTNLKVVTDEHWIPSKEELRRFITSAGKTASANVFVPWIWFRALTGTRPTESTYVEWKDIDFENDQIHIRPKDSHQLKNSQFRVIEISAELKPVLLKWKKDWQAEFEKRQKRHPEEKGFPHDWLFYNPHKQLERANCFSKAFEFARTESGLPNMTPHTLRHFFISYCVMAGIKFFTIARWVGHSNTKMIEEVYGHLSPEYRKKQMSKLNIFGDDAGDGVA